MVAIEGDWPGTYQANAYVKGLTSFQEETEALSGFKRFPTWMWRNHEVISFLSWLKKFNASLSHEQKIGFYGLDLYSLHASINAVLKYLQAADPEAAKRASMRYSCFDHVDKDAQKYGVSVAYGLRKNCQEEAIQQLIEFEQEKYHKYQEDGISQKEAFFSALQNAYSVKSAEAYYRSMFAAPSASWNLRDKHMFDVLTALMGYSDTALGVPPKVIVWAHNSHIGNAAATEMSRCQELNIGQLVKQKYGERSFLLGFLTYEGTVMAAKEWGGPAKIREVTPALKESWESLFHQIGLEQFSLVWNNPGTRQAFEDISPKLERAIGVIYRPETERYSHYFYSHLSSQFDGLVYLDTTTALYPLDIFSSSDEEPPETFPSGI